MVLLLLILMLRRRMVPAIVRTTLRPMRRLAHLLVATGSR